MVDIRKSRKLLYRISFGPMDAGKDKVLDHSQMSNILLFTTIHLAQFIQKNRKVQFRAIYTQGQGNDNRRYKGKIRGCDGRGRGKRNRMTCLLKPGETELSHYCK